MLANRWGKKDMGGVRERFAGSEGVRKSIYTARCSPHRVFLDMFGHAFRARELIWRLFVRDFRVRYRKTLLGFGWAILQPLLWAGIFTVMIRARAVDPGELGAPYVVFALTNMAIWSLFASGLSFCVPSLVNNGAMIIRINLAKDAIIFAAFGNAMVECVARLLLAWLAMVFMGWSLPLTTPLGLLACLPLMLASLGLGMVLSLLNLVIRDVGLIIPFLITMAMLVSPVLYLPTDGSGLDVVMIWNPLTELIRTPSELLIHGRLPNPGKFALASLGAVLAFLLFWYVFTIGMRRAIERV